MAKPKKKRWEHEPGFGLLDKEVSGGEARKGEAVKPVKAADTSKGEARSERPCRGTKELYKGKCGYPGENKAKMKAAKKRKKRTLDDILSPRRKRAGKLDRILGGKD